MLTLASEKRKITPEGDFFPCYLSGHAIRTEPAEGILDDLYVEVMSLKLSDQKLLFISIELIGLQREKSEEMVSTIAKRYGYQEEQIVIGYVHTHSAPEYQDTTVFGHRPDNVAPRYMAWVMQQVYKGVEDCLSKQHQAVTAKKKTTIIDGLYGSRNSLENPGDKEVTLLIFENDDKEVVGSICNFSCHPTVLGPQNRFVSPDLAGYLSRKLEDKYQTNTLIMLGAAGDMSNRLYRQGNDQKELERIGDGIISQLEKNTQWITLRTDSIEVKPFHFNQVYTVDLEKKRQQLADAQYQVDHAETFDKKKVYSSAVAVLKYQVEHFEPTYELDLKCMYIKIGEISIFTMPCELFSKFGTKIKQAMNNQCNLFWGYTFYNAGYLYYQEEAGKSFESIFTNLPAGETERIVDLITKFV